MTPERKPEIFWKSTDILIFFSKNRNIFIVNVPNYAVEVDFEPRWCSLLFRRTWNPPRCRVEHSFHVCFTASWRVLRSNSDGVEAALIVALFRKRRGFYWTWLHQANKDSIKTRGCRGCSNTGCHSWKNCQKIIADFPFFRFSICSPY